MCNSNNHKTKHKNRKEYLAQNIITIAYISCTIIFNIDIYTSKQTKRRIADVAKSNGEIFNVIGAVVIDTHQRTKIEKTLFLSNIATKVALKKIAKQRFFSLCSLMYINNNCIYDTENFSVSFIDTWY